MGDLDDIDRAILRQLQKDGRTPYSELGKAVGLATSSVNERVKKLGERGVITGVHAELSTEGLGLDLLAFIFVGWSDTRAEKGLLARVSEEPAVLECHHVTGGWDYLLKVRVSNMRMLEAFLARVIQVEPGIQRTETMIVLSSAKETPRLPVDLPEWYR